MTRNCDKAMQLAYILLWFHVQATCVYDNNASVLVTNADVQEMNGDYLPVQSDCSDKAYGRHDASYTWIGYSKRAPGEPYSSSQPRLEFIWPDTGWRFYWSAAHTSIATHRRRRISSHQYSRDIWLPPDFLPSLVPTTGWLGTELVVHAQAARSALVAPSVNAS